MPPPATVAAAVDEPKLIVQALGEADRVAVVGEVEGGPGARGRLGRRGGTRCPLVDRRLPLRRLLDQFSDRRRVPVIEVGIEVDDVLAVAEAARGLDRLDLDGRVELH